MDNNNKKMYGQFYTTVNPFHNQLFLNWLNNIDNGNREIIVEPFAGSNNIVDMVQSFCNNEWACFDINPNNNENRVPRFQVEQNDSIRNFPKGFNIAITNPPYLAKNSATKYGIVFPDTEYDDLYKLALSVMLENVGYVAAIIPESFVTQNLFHDRLFGVATLNCRMFDDTECPVCLAMFMPEDDSRKKVLGNDFHYFKGNVNNGLYSQMQAKKEIFEKSQANINWKFNVPTGEIGLFAIDSTTSKSIRFVEGEEISKDKIKVSSRGVTRIAGIPMDLSSKELIKVANAVLNDFRDNTKDIFMTSFRGLRKDGDYRRRLDFALAKVILNHSICKIGGFNA